MTIKFIFLCITKKFVLNLKTRNFEDKVANRWISVEASKGNLNSKIKIAKGRSQKERFIPKDSLNKTAPLMSIAKPRIQDAAKKRESLIQIKAYDSALNRIISWNSIHK